MSSWAEGTKWWQILFCAVLGVLYGVLPPLFLRESNIWLFCVMWFTSSVVAFAGFFYGLTAGIEMIVRRFDVYRSYGQAGFRVIRSLQDFKPYSLSDKESAVRSAHAWRRFGKVRGVDYEWRGRRVFDLLNEHPMTPGCASEIGDLIRDSLIDAASGRFQVDEYEDQRGFWSERVSVELASARLGLMAGFLALFLSILSFVPK